MTFRGSPLRRLLTIALCVLAGCASVPDESVVRRAEEIRIYGGGELPTSRVDVVSHIWADSWKTAYIVPTYPAESDAIAALRVEAARLGADGLVNVVCLDQGRPKWSSRTEPAILCYGNAVRVRQGQ